MENKNINLNFIYIILTGIIWALDSTFLTPQYFNYGVYDTVYIVFITHFLALLIFTVIMPKLPIKILKEFKFRDYFLYFLTSLVGGACGTLAIVKALQLVNYQYSIVAIIQQLQPLFAVVLSLILLKERIRLNFFVVLIIALVSTYVLKFGFILPNDITRADFQPFMYSLIASICFGASTVLSRKVSLDHDFKVSAYARYLITSLIMLSIMIFKNDVSSIVRYTSFDVLKLTIIISLLGIVSLLSYYQGMTKTTALNAALSELSYPFAAVVLNVLTSDSKFHIYQIISGIILVASVFYYNLWNIKNKNVV